MQMNVDTIYLISSEQDVVTVPKDLIMCYSNVIKSMLEDSCVTIDPSTQRIALPLPYLNTKTLRMFVDVLIEIDQRYKSLEIESDAMSEELMLIDVEESFDASVPIYWPRSKSTDEYKFMEQINDIKAMTFAAEYLESPHVQQMATNATIHWCKHNRAALMAAACQSVQNDKAALEQLHWIMND